MAEVPVNVRLRFDIEEARKLRESIRRSREVAHEMALDLAMRRATWEPHDWKDYD